MVIGIDYFFWQFSLYWMYYLDGVKNYGVRIPVQFHNVQVDVIHLYFSTAVLKMYKSIEKS